MSSYCSCTVSLCWFRLESSNLVRFCPGRFEQLILVSCRWRLLQWRIWYCSGQHCHLRRQRRHHHRHRCACAWEVMVNSIIMWSQRMTTQWVCLCISFSIFQNRSQHMFFSSSINGISKKLEFSTLRKSTPGIKFTLCICTTL